MAAEARLGNDGTLVLSGVLDRAAASILWPQLAAHAGRVQRVDLQAVSRLDSSGLALLSQLAGPALEVIGQPQGLDELVAAYRLDAHLCLPSSPSSVV